MQMASPMTSFVDVGGTLWPNTWPLSDSDRAGQLDTVAEALGTRDRARVDAVLVAITERVDDGSSGDLAEAPDRLIADVLAENGLPGNPAIVRRVRHALNVNLGRIITPHADAAGLLREIKELGQQCVILSNTTFRDAAMYARDFDALGWTDWIDGCVTSVDVGWRKPDPRMLQAALVHAGTPPQACVMIGNSEEADIVPAAAMGLRTILVAIEEPPRAATIADATVTSLRQALGILRSWMPQ
jgi:FMN phosphatase YigB (HAD superfamily)